MIEITRCIIITLQYGATPAINTIDSSFLELEITETARKPVLN